MPDVIADGARLACTILAVGAVDVTTSFTANGGSSLAAMRLVAAARRDLGVAVPLESLLSDRSLRDVLGAAAPAGGDEIDPADIRPDDEHVPTPGQRGMWVAEQTVGGSLYGLVFTAFLSGYRFGTAIALLFIAAMICTGLGFAIFLHETQLGTRAVRVRNHILDLELQRLRRTVKPQGLSGQCESLQGIRRADRVKRQAIAGAGKKLRQNCGLQSSSDHAVHRPSAVSDQQSVSSLPSQRAAPSIVSNCSSGQLTVDCDLATGRLISSPCR